MSRDEARSLVLAGSVLVGGAPTAKPDRLVAPGEPLRVLGEPSRFVGRGGLKLDAAVDAFGIDPRGRHALDAGASTGGFTDCLLQRGALSVTALDVGHGQLHERLRVDPRVSNVERTNLRHLDGDVVTRLGGPWSIVVADLSFISLCTVADVLAGATAAVGDLVVLVKPQFEAGRVEASRGRGVIRDPAVWRRAVLGVCSALSAAHAVPLGLIRSPITGGDGNVEFLLHARRALDVTLPAPPVEPVEAVPGAAGGAPAVTADVAELLAGVGL